MRIGYLAIALVSLAWGCSDQGPKSAPPSGPGLATVANEPSPRVAVAFDARPAPDARRKRGRVSAAALAKRPLGQGRCLRHADCARSGLTRAGNKAMCVSNVCTAVALPPLTRCRKNADCVITSVLRGNCCGVGCSPYSNAHHKDDVLVFRQWSERYCLQGSYTCPQFKCARADHETRAVCRSGRCRAKRVKRVQRVQRVKGSGIFPGDL